MSHIQNQIEVSLGRTLRDLRQHDDPQMYIQNQITFWHVVEDIRHTLGRNNKKFDGTKFISAIMGYAGLEPTGIEDEPECDDWFLEKSRGYRTVGEWREYFKN